MRRSRDVHSLLSTAFCLCTNSKAVGGTQPTALPCCPSAAFLGGNVGCLTGSEVGAFTFVPVLPLSQGRHQSDRIRIALACFHSSAKTCCVLVTTVTAPLPGSMLYSCCPMHLSPGGCIVANFRAAEWAALFFR